MQIVEQILPYFQPEYTVTMKMIDDMSDVRDVPITLNSVNMDDQYEGTFEERRVIEYTLDFTMKTILLRKMSTQVRLLKMLLKEIISIVQQVNSLHLKSMIRSSKRS